MINEIKLKGFLERDQILAILLKKKKQVIKAGRAGTQIGIKKPIRLEFKWPKLLMGYNQSWPGLIYTPDERVGMTKGGLLL